MNRTKLTLCSLLLAVPCMACELTSCASASMSEVKDVLVNMFDTGATPHKRKTGYKVIDYPTDNYARDKVNEVQGVILHHTCEPTAQAALDVLTSKERGVSAHVVIDYDGTRYVMVTPTTVAWHAGYSLLHGREKCNDWTLGIEFQGDTCIEPLTQDQIDSAIEWLLPLIAEYHIPIDNIVTHQMIRTAYKKAHPENKKAYNKPDITQAEYKRFMEQLRAALSE